MFEIERIHNGSASLQQTATVKGRTADNNNDSLLFAGDLNLPQAPAGKIRSARKQAMKLVMDAFDKEQSKDKNLDEIREQRADAESDLTERQDRVKSIRENVSNYAKEHGITENSLEQKDLELVRKMRDWRPENPFERLNDPLGCLTGDERERYSEVMDRGLTEYQKLALNADNDIRNAQIEINQDKTMVQAYNSAEKAIKLESLKDQSMVKAQKGKDEIMKAASRDVINSLVQDTAENITEEQDKIKEDAEEKAEKQAEEKEKAEKREEEKKEREILEGEAKLESLNTQYAGSDSQLQVNSEIQNILNKLGLLKEDIKGIEVNEQL
ncbi:MAG: hypothetical protein IJV16_10395 [Lachnospiraceae bacterium]|nr:hypothetical protein [Lachnospiraceae bacterium]